MTHLRINTNPKDTHRKYSSSLKTKEMQIKCNSETLFHIIMITLFHLNITSDIITSERSSIGANL